MDSESFEKKNQRKKHFKNTWCESIVICGIWVYFMLYQTFNNIWMTPMSTAVDSKSHEHSQLVNDEVYAVYFHPHLPYLGLLHVLSNISHNLSGHYRQLHRLKTTC